jgi:hypothetical protein
MKFNEKNTFVCVFVFFFFFRHLKFEIISKLMARPEIAARVQKK